MATVTSLSFRLNSFYNGDGMRQARQDIARLDGSMNALNKSSSALVPGMKDFVATALALGPALVPIAGGLIGIGVAAGSAMVAAGAAVGVFGAAMAGAIKSTVGAGSAYDDSTKALKKAQKALADTTKGTDEYDKALKKVTEAQKNHEAGIKALPPVQEKFVRGYDNMKGAIATFNDENAKFTLGPATTMLDAFSDALPKFSTVIEAMAPTVQRIADSIKGWVNDGGLDRFLIFVKTYGIPALSMFHLALASMLGALGKGMRDTAPLGLAFAAWFRKVMDQFSRWAEGGGFQRFMTWLADNKGQLIQTVKDLGTFLANVGKAVVGLNGAAFSVIGTFFQVLASFPVGLLQVMMYAFIGFSLALKIYAVIAFVAAAATTAMTLAATPFGILFAGMALTIGLVIAAIIALAVGIYFLVKYWDTVWSALKTAALAVWSALQVAWEYTWNAIKTAAVAVWNFLTKGWGQFVLLLLGPIGVVIAIAAHWDQIWGGIKSVASAVWDWMKSAWSATTEWISEKFFAAIAPIREMWNSVWPEMRLAAETVWNNLKQTWAAVWSFFQAAWNVFWSIFGDQFKKAWSQISAVATFVWDILKVAWSVFWETIKGAAQVGWAIIQGTFKVAMSVLTGIWSIFTAALSGTWKVLWAVVSGIFDVFAATFVAMFKGLWDVVRTIAVGVWNVIKAAWDALWKTVTAIFMVFMAAFTGNWSGAWNAVRAAGQAIWNVIRTAFQALTNALAAIFSAFASTFRAGWQAFLTAVQTVWNAVWNAIRSFIQALWNAIVALANAFWTSTKAVFTAGLNAVQATWQVIWNAIRNFVQGVWNNVVTFANTFWASMRTVFTAGSTWLRTTFWNPVRDFFTKTIPSAFDAAAAALGKGWDRIRKLVRDPIQAVVNVVYNKGIVPLWNTVAKVFGADPLKNFSLPAFKEGGPTGDGSSRGFHAILHPDEHVWTADEVKGAGGHEAVARLRQQAMSGSRVRVYGEHSFADGGGFLGTGLGPDVGPDLIPDGIIKNAFGKLKDLALGAISGPFGAAVDGVAKIGKEAVRAAVPGSNTGVEKLGVGMIDKIAKTVKDWVKERDVAPVAAGGGNGFIPWAPWKAGDGTRQNYGGVTVNRRTAAMLNHAVKIAKTAFSMFQGSYSSSVAASAGTHSGGGAVDLGPARDGIVGAMRASGFAAWRRTPAEGFSPHIHGIAVGDPTVSAGAAQQVRDFNRGLNGLAGGGKDTYTAPGGGGTSAAAAKTTARNMLAGYGWSSHWSALEDLWTRESGWRWNADNPTSDAYGIPQALPGSKMSSAGGDWKTNPATQIKWGLGYIKGRYGNPSKANSFQKSHNWYALGTPGAARGPAVVGENGPEVMNLRGGERIDPLSDLVGRGGGDIHVEVPITIQGHADHGVVDRLERDTIPKLTMAIKQGVGRRP